MLQIKFRKIPGSLSVVGGGEFKYLPIQHIDDWTASRHSLVQFNTMEVIHMHNRTDASNIREYLQEYDEDKWGFTIYRTCYYDEQVCWNQFMERLKDFARINALSPPSSRESDGAVSIDLLEWYV